MRRLNVYTICLVLGLSILLIINIGSQYAYYLTSIEHRRNIRIIIKVEDGEDSYTQQIPIALNDDSHGLTNRDIIPIVMNENIASGGIKNISTSAIHRSTDINKILEKARTKIKEELTNYNFSRSNVTGLEDLVMESGGQPLRTLIISSWRSGSTFFGDLINAVPSNYYHYEPLLMFGTKQIRELEEAKEALRMIKQMFKCNFDGLENYFEFESQDPNLFSHSTRLFDYCKDGNKTELCYNAEFVSRLCKLYPFQSMKLVRFRLKLVEEILNDKTLNVKVILLVRDPRGLMQSRRHRHFCELSPDCWEPPLVCGDLTSDYVAAQHIKHNYPDRLMVIRFEDLTLKPNKTTDRILQFLKLDGRQAFDRFLQKHTTVEVAGVHSTFKVSRNIPFKWKHALDFSYVSKLQVACREAMRLWGYKLAHNETHMTSYDFDPIEVYKI
ncbi:hypothetical protein PYW08_015110 [Mythimna loreyi]|uniref:Uncharacterized protein n=1 Tax=Mythimna loreyi TaxID=667449 RepID=A0ACC2QUP1_9NEOP|nr:hypothetical protein PYW08_015110 [Mythimna loreyi]